MTPFANGAPEGSDRAPSTARVRELKLRGRPTRSAARLTLMTAERSDSCPGASCALGTAVKPLSRFAPPMPPRDRRAGPLQPWTRWKRQQEILELKPELPSWLRKQKRPTLQGDRASRKQLWSLAIPPASVSICQTLRSGKSRAGASSKCITSGRERGGRCRHEARPLKAGAFARSRGK